jgi:hypothetical protein
MRDEDKLFVVKGSGEIVREIQQGDRILTDNSVKHLTDTMPIKNKFLKVNDMALSKLDIHSGFICCLLPYISFTDGALRHGNGCYLTANNYNKISPRYFRKQIKELIDLDVIHKCKNYSGSFFYAFNPYIAMRGKRITKELYEEFKETKWRDIE